MNYKPLLIGALGFLTIRGMNKVQAAQSFTYDIEGFPDFKMDGSTAIVTFKVVVKNTASERFDIRSIYGRLSFNGSYVGDFNTLSPVTISGYSRTVIPVTLSLYLTNIVTSLLTALTINSGSLVFQVSGSVVTNLVSIPMVFTKRFR